MGEPARDDAAESHGAADPTPDGLRQIEGYLTSLGLAHGGLVVFGRQSTATPVAERTQLEERTTPGGLAGHAPARLTGSAADGCTRHSAASGLLARGKARELPSRESTHSHTTNPPRIRRG